MGARGRGRAVAAHQVRAAHERAREDRGARLAGREGLIGGVVARLRRHRSGRRFLRRDARHRRRRDHGAAPGDAVRGAGPAEGAYSAPRRGHGDGDDPLHLGRECARARGARRDPLGHRPQDHARHSFGGLAGSWVASFIPPAVFAAIFTGVIYIAATNLLLDRKPRASREPPGWAGMFVFGFLVSALSAFTAIGGAFMTVPFMLWCNVPMLQAIGTAAVIGFPIALSG